MISVYLLLDFGVSDVFLAVVLFLTPTDSEILNHPLRPD